MFQLGPVALPILPVVLLVIFGMGLIVASLFARKNGQEKPVRDTAFNGLLVGLIAARIGFVLLYWEQYSSLLSIIDIRDRGFSPLFGIPFALFFIAFKSYRQKATALPLAAGTALVLLLGALTTYFAQQITQGVNLPTSTVTTLNSEPVSFVALSNKPKVINLWATWCPPCRREMPLLTQAHQHYPDIDFLLVNQGESSNKVFQFLKSQSLSTSTILLDPLSEISREMAIQGMPATLFYDANGRLVDMHLGELSAATLQRYIERIAIN